MAHILIAEDEAKISSFLDKGLRADGFVTTTVADGESAFQFARSGEFDLMILDLGLPLRDGLSVLKALRLEQVPLPVIVLTARDSTADVVAGLDSGADDYVRKPFAFDELLARVRTRLRSEATAESAVFSVGDLALDLRTRRASVAGHSVELTAREFLLADVLARHAGQVLSRQQLLSRVWGFDFDPGSNIVDAYIRRLRRKLGRERVETVRGLGYRLRSDT